MRGIGLTAMKRRPARRGKPVDQILEVLAGRAVTKKHLPVAAVALADRGGRRGATDRRAERARRACQLAVDGEPAARIHSSASRREPRPSRASTFCRRSGPAPRSAVEAARGRRRARSSFAARSKALLRRRQSSSTLAVSVLVAPPDSSAWLASTAPTACRPDRAAG